MLQDLIATLKAVGKSTELYQTDDGTRVLILPYGGRILGVFAPGSDENFLWTNSALDTAESARAYYASDDWQNSGGDRTWLAPEVDFFFPKFPNIDIAGYWQPRSLDPGNYELTKTAHGVKLTNRLKIDAFRSRKRVELEITKSVAAAPNPLRYDTANSHRRGGICWAHPAHVLEDPRSESRMTLPWSAYGVSRRCRIRANCLFRLTPKTEPRIYFGLVDTPPDELTMSDRLVRFKMRAPANIKSEYAPPSPPAASATSIPPATSTLSSSVISS